MTSLDSIVRFLNRELKVSAIPDSSRNGLQVRGKGRVRKIGFAVDASLAVFELARKKGCDLLVVHHGILWKGARDTLGTRRRRIQYLKRHGMSLYACHLPLDLHPVHGNNAQLARILGLLRLKKFGRYKGRLIGFSGRLPKARTVGWVAVRLNRALHTKCVVLPFGGRLVRIVGVVSGGGADALTDAVSEGLDLFVTGEASHQFYHEARDAGQSVVIAGHYHTETVGVAALMALLRKRFGVKGLFIDFATSI